MGSALCGSCEVRVLIVDGPDLLQITPQVAARVSDQIDRCLSYLAGLEPRARLRFDVSVESALVVPRSGPGLGGGVGARDSDQLEEAWLPQALGQLGYSSFDDFLGRDDTAQNEQRFGVVISRHLKPHYAYAAGSKITLSPSCGGRGVRYLHALLLHEICHVFGAVDEYPDCHCSERGGNDNCYVCNPSPEPCIMAGNSLSLCPATRRQIGWTADVLEAL